MPSILLYTCPPCYHISLQASFMILCICLPLGVVATAGALETAELCGSKAMSKA